ncbi:MAG: FtsX-like permease family protein [Candidatus Hodarchaeales archaeon]
MHFMSRYWILKLVRDIKSEKFLFTAIIILSLSGVGSYLALTLGYSNLESSYELIYDKTNFADVEINTYKDIWFNISEVRQNLSTFLKNHKEINNINYRLILDSGYNVTSNSIKDLGRHYITGGRIIGINTTLDKFERVNDLIIQNGEYLSPDNNTNQVLLEYHFADKFQIKPGDILNSKILNISLNLSITGIVYSPEYLVVIPSRFDFLPSSTFGIVYMSLQSLQNITNLRNQANNIVITMEDTLSEQEWLETVNSLMSLLNNITDNAFTPPIMQENQISNLALKLDLETFQEIAFILPLIVLAVASIAMYITLGRLVNQQKRNIGIASCLGYYPVDLFLHYTSFTLLIGLVGSTLGVILGTLLSYAVTYIYSYFMRFPAIIQVNPVPHTILFAFSSGIAISLLGGAIPAWKASRLNPREALQIMPSISKGSKSLIEKILFWRNFNIRVIIALRNLFRQRYRTSATIISLAASVMILIVAMSFVDSINAGFYRQFTITSQYDMTIKYEEINFFDLGVNDDISFLRTIPGVVAVEPIFQLPSILQVGNKQESVLITAWNNSNPAVHHFQWSSEEDRLLENNSIVICPSLARSLNSKTGEVVNYGYPAIPDLNLAYSSAQLVFNVWSSWGKERARNETIKYLSQLIEQSTESLSFSKTKKELRYQTTEVNITGISNEIWGNIIYTTANMIVEDMGLTIFKTGLNIDLTPCSQIILKISQPHNLTLLEDIQNRILERLDSIRSIDFGHDFQQSVFFLLNIFNVVIGLLFVFACVLAGATIFTTIYVNFQERQREIATMLTLGLYDSDFFVMLSIENIVQSVLAILLGIPLGMILSKWLLTNILRIFYFQISITLGSILLVSTGIIIVVIASQIPALRKMLNLDLAVVSKDISS